jgi:2-polyprenyl-3-methyl-5-hydroxy-6-metoxy-1,4-benzoquinol methylase
MPVHCRLVYGYAGHGSARSRVRALHAPPVHLLNALAAREIKMASQHVDGARPTQQPGMAEAEMRKRMAELAPFHHAVELPFGLNTYDEASRRQDRQSMGRINSVKKHVWPRLMEHFGGTLQGKRVLDVACNCGGFSILASDAGADEVVGFDSEERYIDQAKFIREARQDKRVRFELDQLGNVSEERYGRFDVSFFFGILYHLEDPIGGLRRIASLTADTMVVDTHLMRIPYIHRFFKMPLWGMSVVEPVEGNDTTGLWRKSQHCQFKPTREAVEQALRFVGFEKVEYLPPTARGLEDRYYKRTRGAFIARRR